MAAKKEAKKKGRQAGVNKSAAIREYMASNPDAKPKDVVAGLKEQGLEVAVGLVNQVRSKRSGGAGSGGGRGRGRGKSGDLFSADDVFRVQKLASELGGVGKLQSIVDLLARMG